MFTNSSGIRGPNDSVPDAAAEAAALSARSRAFFSAALASDRKQSLYSDKVEETVRYLHHKIATPPTTVMAQQILMPVKTSSLEGMFENDSSILERYNQIYSIKK